MKDNTLILGAGLAGLSTAYHLDKAGQSDWQILESFSRSGGLCRSIEYESGFTFDHSIHILYSADPYATELIKGILKDNLLIQKREAWVNSFGEYTPYPWQANTYGLPADVIKQCLDGVEKATKEAGTAPEPKNFRQWCFKTFGEGLAKHFMVPYNTKLWAIDLDEMTDAWIRDRVLTPSIDEVREGSLRRQEKSFGPNSVFWYPESGGIESLPAGLMKRIDASKVSFNTTVKKILWKEKLVIDSNGERRPYEKLVSTLPLPRLAELLDPALPADISEAAGRLVYNRVYAVNIAVKRTDISTYHWVYYPEEKYIFHRISFPGNFSSTMVPGGWSSITVEISGSKTRTVPKGQELVDEVVKGLREAKVLSETDGAKHISTMVLNPAYVIYNHTHRSDVDSLHSFFKDNAIYPCGRFGDWEYLNMDHSILSGKRAAEESLG